MSAINSKKGKKKNNKKKNNNNKKQGGTPVDSSAPPSEISSPALTDNENLIQEESAVASALPAPPIEPVEEVSTPTSKIPAGGPVGVGAAGAGATAAAVAVAARKSISHASASLPEKLPLTDNIKYCIKTVVASGSIDTLSIAKTIAKNVEAGDYKAKAALPAAAAKPTPVVPTPPKDTPVKDAAAAPTNFDAGKSNPVKKAVAGVGAAATGAGAAVAAAVKSKGGEKGGENASVVTEKTKLSENVQACIQSAVQAPSVDVYGILENANPNKVKCPEPAVGGSTQPTMPSSAKTADTAAQPASVPPKINEAHTKKSKENRKSGLAALKKKNCIIL